MVARHIRLKDALSGFVRNRRGNVGVIVAGTVSVLIGSTAIGVDMNYLFSTRAQLRYTADAAAIAAAAQLPDVAAVTAKAIEFADKNMDPSLNGNVTTAADVAVGNWNVATRVFTPDLTPFNAVRVAARRSQENDNPAELYFAAALGIGEVDLSADAVAALGDNPACILALNPNASSALHVQGTAFVRAVDCNIHVNSDHSTQALYAQGNVDLIAEEVAPGATAEIHVVGGVREQGPANISPAAETGSDPAPDPFADAVSPAGLATLRDGACDQTNFSANGSVALDPGVYCGGISITGNGTAEFRGTGDGIYVIKDGELNIAGNINVDADDGVAFFFTGAAARIDFGGTADIAVKAPSTGALKGFVAFGDPLNPATSAHRMRGTALGGYEGAIYLPNAVVDFHGTADGVIAGGSDCTIVVADSFIFAGTSTFHAEGTCTNYPDLIGGPSKPSLVN